jgi:hypothetical protein
MDIYVITKRIYLDNTQVAHTACYQSQKLKIKGTLLHYVKKVLLVI